MDNMDSKIEEDHNKGGKQLNFGEFMDNMKTKVEDDTQKNQDAGKINFAEYMDGLKDDSHLQRTTNIIETTKIKDNKN